MASRISISILHIHSVISHPTNMFYFINVFLLVVSISKKTQVNGKNLLIYDFGILNVVIHFFDERYL
jgi:hypothetical protein